MMSKKTLLVKARHMSIMSKTPNLDVLEHTSAKLIEIQKVVFKQDMVYTHEIVH